MTNVPSRVECEQLVRAEKWFPWRGGWAEGCGASISTAAKASLAKLKAIRAKIDAYEKSQRQPAQDVEVVA
jgi:hypothetical protein